MLFGEVVITRRQFCAPSIRAGLTRPVLCVMDDSPMTKETNSKLEGLFGMKQKGILDSAEFKAEKKRVLDHQDELRRIRRSKLVSAELSVLLY